MKKINKLKKITQITMAVLVLCNMHEASASLLSFTNVPLFLVSNATPNIMIIYGNSNSMDEQADGQAVGSASIVSKSEISRTAVKVVINANLLRFNMGLSAYGQTGVLAQDLSNSPYDISYNPSYYNPIWIGARNSATNKKFRITNPANTSSYIYYNVALPSYGPVQANKANNNLYCFTSDTRSNAFSNGEVIVNNNLNDANSGPWLPFNCYTSKKSLTAPYDAGPTAGAINNAPTSNGTVAGYSSLMGTYNFYPTDSDLAQGITNYGNQLSQSYVSPAWFANSAVGYGYIHTPIATLTNAQAAKMITKLGTSQFTTSGTETNAAYPLVNAGLSPIASTVNTVTNYFNGNLSQSIQGGPLAAPPNSCGLNFNIILTDGLPSVLANGQISYDPPTLLNDLTASVTNARNNGIYSYVVGFALPYGVTASQLDQIAAAGGTTKSYLATDAATLNAVLSNVFSSIVATTSASSSVALNSGYISSGDYIYQARFQSSDWSGDLLAIPVSAKGVIPGDQVNNAAWRSGVQINAQSYTSRNIITMKGSSGVGIPFRWPANIIAPTSTELDTTQSTLLNTNPTTTLNDGAGNKRLNFLRGDGTYESSLFRTRTYKLGDIIDSAPIIEIPPNGVSNSASYTSFKQAYASRPKVVFVGANDGMMHAINTTNGNEIFGYVPNAVFNQLNQLTSPTYKHQYFVDGSPNISDINNSVWKTVLVSGMGQGAKGIFALDITNPTTFNETNASTLAKFEYTSANNADLGYIQGQPSIVKLNNGKYAAVFGNGYNNSGNGQADLFIVDADTGVLIREITTGAGSPSNVNGLSPVSAIDSDGNGTVDYVYGGDLNGNMWKFDITSTNPANWGVSFSGSPLFNTGKPITTQPEVTLNPISGGNMIEFGTGLYLQSSDNSSLTANAFYGLWDNGTPITSLSSLVQQTVTSTVVGSPSYRNVSQNPVSYPAQRGWYLTFPTAGERNVSNAVLQNGNITFSTVIPSTATCSYGGTSWLYTLNFLNGNQNNAPTYDTNKDGVINSSDANYGSVGLASIASSPTILQGLGTNNSPMQEVFLNQSNGSVVGIITSTSQNGNKRISWKQIIKN